MTLTTYNARPTGDPDLVRALLKIENLANYVAKLGTDVATLKAENTKLKESAAKLDRLAKTLEIREY